MPAVYWQEIGLRPVRRRQPDTVHSGANQWSKNCVQQLKNVKSHVFLDFEKNVKTYVCSFRGHLINPVFNTQLPKVSTGVTNIKHLC